MLFGSSIRPSEAREPRPTSLVFRPASSGGPAPLILSPPPARSALPRGRAPPYAVPRRQSCRSTRPFQYIYETIHNVSKPRSSVSLTPEEGFIQLQIWTQRADSKTPPGYRKSFRYVIGLTSRTLPTASRLLQLSITAAPVNAHLDGLGDDEIQSKFEESQIGSVSVSPSDKSEPLSAPPDASSGVERILVQFPGTITPLYVL